MKLKTYKSKRGILNAAIQDIEAGQWCKKELATVNSDDAKGHEALEDYVDSGDAALKDKPIGCALGLCVMHGGDGEEFAVMNEIPHILVRVNYPNARSSEGVKDAVRALFNALPDNGFYKRRAVKTLTRYRDSGILEDSDEMELMNDAIMRHNDKKEMTAQKALDWFRRALAGSRKAATP